MRSFFANHGKAMICSTNWTKIGAKFLLCEVVKLCLMLGKLVFPSLRAKKSLRLLKVYIDWKFALKFILHSALRRIQPQDQKTKSCSTQD